MLSSLTLLLVLGCSLTLGSSLLSGVLGTKQNAQHKVYFFLQPVSYHKWETYSLFITQMRKPRLDTS